MPELALNQQIALKNISLGLNFTNGRFSYQNFEESSGVATAQHPSFDLNASILSLPFVELAGLPALRKVHLHLDFATQAFALRNLENIPLVLGAYTSGFIGTESVIQSELRDFDTWAGKKMSIAGTFMGITGDNPAYNVPNLLGLLEKYGYTGLINFNTHSHSMAELAGGTLDSYWQAYATAFAAWFQQKPEQIVFIAPLPEMNGLWESYGGDAANFKIVFARIQAIFAQAGVSRDNVRWVFAPNGWSESGHEFEKYYPGADKVDVVGFSGYNWGTCANAAQKQWQNAAQIFGPYLPRMRAMAPDKPIFIMQTASTSEGGDKDQWLQDTYHYLAQQTNVRAALYFNIDKECDWPVFRPNGSDSPGYQEALKNTAIDYLEPAALRQATR